MSNEENSNNADELKKELKNVKRRLIKLDAELKMAKAVSQLLGVGGFFILLIFLSVFHKLGNLNKEINYLDRDIRKLQKVIEK